MLDFALSQGVPPEKLSMGIPIYSGHWFATHSEAKSIYAGGRSVDYATASGLVEQYGAKLIWLEEQGASYALWSNRGTFEYVFMEDRRAFDAKLDVFAAYEGLRGISVWVLGVKIHTLGTP